jgi:hypothetical protein
MFTSYFWIKIKLKVLWWGQGVILCLCIDDILIFGTSLDVINEAKTFLCQSFDMKEIWVTLMLF